LFAKLIKVHFIEPSSQIFYDLFYLNSDVYLTAWYLYFLLNLQTGHDKKQGEEGLTEAAVNGHLDILNTLLTVGVDIGRNVSGERERERGGALRPINANRLYTDE